jgi:hypothetical protein
MVPFRMPEEAGAGAGRILRDDDAHRRPARALAETDFNSDKVLGRVREEVGVTV